MKQDQFIKNHQSEWDGFELQIKNLGGKKQRQASSLLDFPQRYRRLCQYLAIAKSRQYSNQLIIRLNALVLQGHQRLYRQDSRFFSLLFDYIARDFPLLIRQEARLVGWSGLLFFGPLFATLLWVGLSDNAIYHILSPAEVANVEAMYNPNRVSDYKKTRESDSDFLMFGFYIKNNIGIAFRTFASGVFFGVGSVLLIIFNGYHIGAITGLMINLNYYETFFPFVIGHGSFELTALVLAGAAGLKLGQGLIHPGNLGRSQALRQAAAIAIKIMYGVSAMLLLAAFIEAFWSSSTTLPALVKYVVGGFLWLLVTSYFLFTGKKHEA